VEGWSRHVTVKGGEKKTKSLLAELEDLVEAQDGVPDAFVGSQSVATRRKPTDQLIAEAQQVMISAF